MKESKRSHRLEEEKLKDVYSLLSSIVAPRPIAFVATQSKDKVLNLAPFSFFNIFSISPAIIGFSTINRLKDGKGKDTLNNLKENPFASIQLVKEDMVEKVNQCSIEYAADIDEFKESGFTPIPSQEINVPRVKEASIQMECELEQILELGQGPGAGNLILLKVKRVYTDVALWENGHLIPDKMNLVGRNGGPYYTKAFGDALFTFQRPT